MMLALYGLLAWSLIGGIAALVMGRAIAICNGPERDDATLGGSLRPMRPQTAQDLETRKVA
jgi:hypothetical protein